MRPEVVNGIFAIAGVFLGILGHWLVSKRLQQRKRLAVVVSPLAKLLDVGDQVKSDVKIVYKEQQIEHLYMGEVAIQNTGNVPVQDVEAKVSANEGTALIDFEVGLANFEFDGSSLSLGGDDKCRSLNVDYLNANDRIVIAYKLAGPRKAPEVVVRKMGVEVINKRDFVGWIPDIYAEVVFEAFSAMPLFNVFGRTVKPYRLYLEARKKREAKQPGNRSLTPDSDGPQH